MDKTVKCPQCGAAIRIPAEASIGSKIQCASCGKALVLSGKKPPPKEPPVAKLVQPAAKASSPTSPPSPTRPAPQPAASRPTSKPNFDLFSEGATAETELPMLDDSCLLDPLPTPGGKPLAGSRASASRRRKSQFFNKFLLIGGGVTIVLLLIAYLVLGRGGSPPLVDDHMRLKELTDQIVAGLEEASGILAGIHDETSLRTAVSSVRAIAQRLQPVREEIRAMAHRGVVPTALEMETLRSRFEMSNCVSECRRIGELDLPAIDILAREVDDIVHGGESGRSPEMIAAARPRASASSPNEPANNPFAPSNSEPPAQRDATPQKASGTPGNPWGVAASAPPTPDDSPPAGSAASPAPENPFVAKSESPKQPENPFADKTEAAPKPENPFADKPASAQKPENSFADKPASAQKPENPFADKPEKTSPPENPFAETVKPAPKPGNPFADKGKKYTPSEDPFADDNAASPPAGATAKAGQRAGASAGAKAKPENPFLGGDDPAVTPAEVAGEGSGQPFAGGRPTEIAGGGGMEFRDAGPADGLLVGFEFGLDKFGDNDIIKSVRPIFRTGDGKLVLGNRHGRGEGRTVRVQAKPGYAVASITVRSAIAIDGLSVEFAKVAGASLHISDAYQSEWVGGSGGFDSKRLGGRGVPVMGIVGHATERECSGIGLLLKR